MEWYLIVFLHVKWLYDISAAVSECSVIVGFNDDGGSITVQWLDVVLRVSIGCVIVLYHVVIDTKDNWIHSVSLNRFIRLESYCK